MDGERIAGSVVADLNTLQKELSELHAEARMAAEQNRESEDCKQR